METLLPEDVLNDLPPAEHEEIVGKQFFPEMISTPLVDSLRAVFAFSALLAFLAAIASFGRGARFVHDESEVVTVIEPALSQRGSAGGR
jgi:hypothetical protein